MHLFLFSSFFIKRSWPCHARSKCRAYNRVKGGGPMTSHHAFLKAGASSLIYVLHEMVPHTDLTALKKEGPDGAGVFCCWNTKSRRKPFLHLIHNENWREQKVISSRAMCWVYADLVCLSLSFIQQNGAFLTSPCLSSNPSISWSLTEKDSVTPDAVLILLTSFLLVSWTRWTSWTSHWTSRASLSILFTLTSCCNLPVTIRAKLN